MRVRRLRERVEIMFEQGKISGIFGINKEGFDHELRMKHFIKGIPG